jgi:RHS repeat-associated protein
MDAYRYDNVGNITSLTNTAVFHDSTGIGGTMANTYTYDVLNRLSSSVGNFVGKPTQPSGNDNRSNYTLAMAYGNTGTITTKTQLHSKNGANFAPNTYTNNYTYISGSHKLWKLTDQSNVVETFSYDNDGNVTRRVKNSNTTNLYWDEANRLRVVAAPSGAMQHYIYDASGERVVKGNGSATTVYVNGTPVSTSVTMTSYTTYPSGYVVVDGTGTYSKHYYMGTQRIASRTGDGTAAIFQGKSPEPNGLRELQQQDLMNYASQAGIKTVEYAEFKPSDADEQLDGDGSKAPAAIAIYYYHPDHLGSNTLLTDMTGKPYQLFLNLPFGETMAEQFTTGGAYLNKWKFNGKELDAETGLYYYGARYYDPRSSVWLGVDPKAEKYPNIGGYVYCANNPLIFIDPTGEFILGYQSSMQMRGYNQVMGSGNINPIFSLAYGTNNTYSIFSSPNYQSAGNFIYQASIPDVVTYNASPNTPLPETDRINGYFPSIDNQSRADRTGNAIGSVAEWAATATAGAVNSMTKNEYIDIVNTREAFSMAYNVVMGNNEMVTSAFNSVNWSKNFKALMGNGGFDIRNFQADVMNYITDGNLDMVNFQVTGYGSDFNQYRTAVYQLGERLLDQPGVDLNIPQQNTFWNNAWDTYLYMGK